MDEQDGPRQYWLVNGAGKDNIITGLPLGPGDSSLRRLRERAARRGRRTLRVVVRRATSEEEGETQP